jgi:hypothetical protein
MLTSSSFRFRLLLALVLMLVSIAVAGRLPAQSAGDEKGLFCGSWGPTRQIDGGCRFAFRCVFKRQQETFHTYQHQRQCRWGIQVQTWTTSSCGC